MKPIIEAIKDPCISANDDFATIYGHPKRKRTYHRHQDGSEYSHIQGALAWPSSGPGCVVIIGVTREEDPSYKIFEAAFHDYPRNLLDCCGNLKEKYTPADDPRLLQQWVGENLFEELLAEKNKGQTFPLFFTPPNNIEKKNSDDIFIEKIRTLAETGKISIAPQKVSDELKAMTKTDAEIRLTSFPAAAAVGYALHYLSVHRPWLTGGGSAINIDSF